MKRITLKMRPLIFILTLVSGINFVNSQVGIGTTSPLYQFQMVNDGNIGATYLAEFTNDGLDGVALGAYNSETANNGFNAFEGVIDYIGTVFTPSGVYGLALNSSDTIDATTIGVSGHSNEWQGIGVQGSRFNSLGPDTGFGGLFYSDLGYTGGIFNISDRRTKADITVLDNALNTVAQLNPVQYRYDLGKYPYLGLSNKMEYGFIAQEMREVLPEITRVKKLNTMAASEASRASGVEVVQEEFLMMDYTRLIPILTKAIQEQSKIIEDQNSRISDLEDRLKKIEAALNGND